MYMLQFYRSLRKFNQYMPGCGSDEAQNKSLDVLLSPLWSKQQTA